MKHDELFTPPSREGTVVLPGFDGGGEWGGAAVDRATGVIYVNASDVPWIAALQASAQRATASAPQTGEAIYAANCASCHRADRGGDGGRTPSLVGVTQRRSVAGDPAGHRARTELHARVREPERSAEERDHRVPRRHATSSVAAVAPARTDDASRLAAAPRRRDSSSSATSAGATRTAIRRSSRRGARSARST